MPYLLDLEKLQLGDIILQSGTSKFSWWIKKGTRSDYSHAMLYVGHSIIHALTEGVYSTNPQRIIVNSDRHLKVLRSKSQLTESSRNIICNYARNLSGSLYNKVEAISSPILNRFDKEAISSGQFCSRLVAQAYKQAGISISNNPDYTTPENINKSSSLIEVKNCLIVAEQRHIDFAATDDPILENQKRTFQWLNVARTLFANRRIKIQTINDVAEALMENQDLDNEISKHIKDSKYLEHYDYDKVTNSYRYNLPLFIKKYQETDIDFFFQELNKEPDLILRHSNNYFQSGLNYAHLGLEFHKLHTELYKNLLKLSEERISILFQFATIIRQPKLIEITNYLLTYIKKII